MIDENKLIEELETLKAKTIIFKSDLIFNDAINTVIKKVNEQPKINEWIPVEKELPKTKGEYLVSYHPSCWDNVSKEISVGLDSFRGKSSWARKKYQKVIAWMPLPESYKGSDKNVD